MPLLAPMSDQRRFAVVILAAGQGTRMRSDTHKVLHPIASRPLLLHLLDRVDALGADKRVVVVGKGREQVEAAIGGRDVTVAFQAEQKGTGHAVQQAVEALAGYDGPVLILYGDTPFVQAETLRRMLDRLDGGDGPGVVVLASCPENPLKYGRIILGEGDRIAKMVEYKDATEEERAVRLCNSGMMAIRAKDLFRWLAKVGNDNAAGEYYLPDVVNIAAAEGREAVVIEGDPYETAGVNSRAELAHLELEWQRRRREQVLHEGATLIDPESVWFAYDTKLGRDVTVEPHVVFGPGVEVADGATIHAFSHIEGATIGAKAKIGPFARIRPGTTLADNVIIGSYVEVKNSEVGPGSKVPHLTYVGDATIGAHSNIGAATVFVNYDGVAKHRSTVGDHVRIGSDTMIVAPIDIGDGAYTAAGSVITADVPPGAMAVARAHQRNVAGWTLRKRSGTPSADAAERALSRNADATAEEG